MIFVHYQDNIGLGNQFLIYGNAYAIAKREKQKMFFYKAMDYMKERPYILDEFNIDNSLVAGEFSLIGMNNKKLKKLVKRCIDTLMRKLPNVFYYREKPSDSRRYIELPSSKNYYLIGNYESYLYVESVLPELKQQFIPQFDVSVEVKKLWEKIELDRNSVAIHIRMGDFVKLNRNYPIEYYEKAVEHHRKINPDAHFYLISQDREVKEHFNREYITIIDLPEMEHLDLVEWYCLALCRNHILSSSTFSWWAALLSDSGSIVVIPSEELYYRYDYLPQDNGERYHSFYKPEWLKDAISI